MHMINVKITCLTEKRPLVAGSLILFEDLDKSKPLRQIANILLNEFHQRPSEVSVERLEISVGNDMTSHTYEIGFRPNDLDDKDPGTFYEWGSDRLPEHYGLRKAAPFVLEYIKSTPKTRELLAMLGVSIPEEE